MQNPPRLLDKKTGTSLAPAVFLAILLSVVGGAVTGSWSLAVHHADFSSTTSASTPSQMIPPVTENPTPSVLTEAATTHTHRAPGAFAPSMDPALSKLGIMARADARESDLSPAPSVGNVTQTVVLSNGSVVSGNFFPTNAAGLNAVVMDDSADSVFVVDALSDNVSVINASTGDLLATVPVGATPVSATYDTHNGLVYIENGVSDNISVINGTTNGVVGSLDAGANPLAGVFDTSNHDLYFADAGSNSVIVVNDTTNAVVTSIPVGNCPGGGGAGSQSELFDPLNNFVYVANECSDNISAINAVTNAVAGSVAVGGSPVALALDPTNGYLFVANANSSSTKGNLTVIDTSTLLTIDSVAVGDVPDSLAYDQDNSLLYVVNQLSNNVSVVNASTLQQVSTVVTGVGPDAIVFDNSTDRVFAASFYSDNLTVIEGTPGSALLTISIGADPSAVTFDPGNNLVYVANVGWNNLTVLNATTGDLVGSIAVGDGPTDIYCAPASHTLLVTDALSDNLTIVDTVSASVVASIPVGGFPDGVTFDSTNGIAYVANIQSQNISLVDLGTRSTIGAISVPNVGAVLYDSSNELLYANSGGGNVSVINTTTNSTIAVVPVGYGPFALTFDTANGDVYVAIFGGTVSVINASTNLGIATIPAGVAPDAIAYDNANGLIYVANLESNNLTVIDGVSQTVVGSIPVGDGPNSVAIVTDPGIVATDSYSGSASLVSSVRLAAHSLTFKETGLLPAATWGVTLGVLKENATIPTPHASSGAVRFKVPSGTLDYEIVVPSGYGVSRMYGPGNPNLTSGTPVYSRSGLATWTIEFGPLETITFMESTSPSLRLYSGAEWYVNLSTGLTHGGGESYSTNTTGSSVTFLLPSGSLYRYSLSVPGSPEYKPLGVPSLFRVPGHSVTITVRFRLLTETIKFEESGLPHSGTWTVTIQTGSTPALTFPFGITAGAGSQVIFKLPVGTYSYDITDSVSQGPPPTPNPSSGTVVVTQVPSAPQVIQITFS